MKVLFFSHQADFIYGGEICTLEMMRELSQQDKYQISFASPQGKYFEAAKEIVPVTEIQSVQFSRNLFKLFPFLLAWMKTHQQLLALIQKESISIVHTTSLKAMVYLWLLGFKDRVNVIWHHHDILSQRWDNNLWLRFIASAAVKIVVPSEAAKKALVAAGIANDKVESIPNGFAVDKVKKRVPEQRRVLKLAFVGEISFRKGVDRLVEIVESLQKKYPEQFHLQIIGAAYSDPRFGEQMEAKFQPFVDRSTVEFLGRRENILELLQDIDLLLVPSRQDPLPTVIIEANMVGVPVLASPVGGIPEMIEVGVTGYLCNSAEDYVERIGEVLLDMEQLKELSRNARDFVEKKFSSSRMAKKITQTYDLL